MAVDEAVLSGLSDEDRGNVFEFLSRIHERDAGMIKEG